MRTARTNHGRRSARWAICLSVMALALPAAAAEKQNLFIQWGGRFEDKIEPVWVAQIESGDRGVEQTSILLREHFGDPSYVRLPPFAARAVALTSDSTELVMLLENRRWLWFSTTRASYGPLLPSEPRGPGMPEETRIITLAGDRRSLWALGEADLNSTVAPTPPAATTTPQQPVTRPTTRPAEPSVYCLEGEKWKRQPAPWPAGTTPSQWAAVSMALVGGSPCVAIPLSAREVAMYRLAHDGQSWQPLGSARSDKPILRFKTLDLSGNPGVWLFDERRMGRVWTEGREFALLLDEQVPTPAAPEVDVTVAGSVIRCVLVNSRDRKLYEQRYSLGGVADSKPTPLVATNYSGEPAFNWPATLAMSAVAVLIVSVLLRRRAEAQDEDGEDSSEE